MSLVDSENTSHGEGRDIEQVARKSKKHPVFTIILSLTLASTFIGLFVLILALYILPIILYLCYYILLYLLLVGLSDFPHISKKTIVHFNSYLEELRGDVLEPLIENQLSRVLSGE